MVAAVVQRMIDLDVLGGDYLAVLDDLQLADVVADHPAVAHLQWVVRDCHVRAFARRRIVLREPPPGLSTVTSRAGLDPPGSVIGDGLIAVEVDLEVLKRASNGDRAQFLAQRQRLSRLRRQTPVLPGAAVDEQVSRLIVLHSEVLEPHEERQLANAVAVGQQDAILLRLFEDAHLALAESCRCRRAACARAWPPFEPHRAPSSTRMDPRCISSSEGTRRSRRKSGNPHGQQGDEANQ